MISSPIPARQARPRQLGLARVLVVHSELAPRLTLQTILQAGGYTVDGAATAQEALCRLDDSEYQLVLCNEEIGGRNGGRDVLAYARIKAYHPATAVINSSDLKIPPRTGRGRSRLSVHTEGVPHLLAKVADLIGMRASRRYRPARQSA
jgi:CheY-like chemotaxis protein